ncbi:hypothetical protein CWI81_00985 [Idiomarina seosinensis]|uniref:Uncharacterized protein n=1 Tax=Idiomarina seosinensis TaxID=281739 RepID=A0A432ZGL5_9GAMM|nr:hypothetical protein CWI81_00985 [Idiomarina seosinensis]
MAGSEAPLGAPAMVDISLFKRRSVLRALILMASENPFRSQVAFGLPKGQVVVATLDGGIRRTSRGLPRYK